ncbi:hypothetical protein H4R19_006756 [Coemansia spiralis]|nr:hypothetical protein H4R19_006756 [Coemansia spiralis]
MSNGQMPNANALDILSQLSTEIGAGLNRQQLAVAMGLLRQGVSPDALAAITQELRREAQSAEQNYQPAARSSGRYS